MMSINWGKPWVQWATLFFLSIIWGSSFILMKRGMVAFSPEQVAALRLFSASTFLVLIGYKHFRRWNRRNFVPILVVGLFGNGIPAFLFTRAETVLDTSIVGILNALVPLFTLILGVLVFRVGARAIHLVGVLLGLVGALFLLYPELRDAERSHLLYAALPILATICYATSVNTIKTFLQEEKSLTITTLAMFQVGLLSGIYLFSTDFTDRLTADHGWNSLGYTLLLGIVGTAVAVLIFNMLIKHTTALFASSVTYLIPLVAVFWGFLDGETIGTNHLGGITLILAGVYLTHLKKRKNQSPTLAKQVS